MNLTLGEEVALTDQTVTETLTRVTSEIKKEESGKFKAEQAAHLKTQKSLAAEREAKKVVKARISWGCSRNARIYSWPLAVVIGILWACVLASGPGQTRRGSEGE